MIPVFKDFSDKQMNVSHSSNECVFSEVWPNVGQAYSTATVALTPSHTLIYVPSVQQVFIPSENKPTDKTPKNQRPGYQASKEKEDREPLPSALVIQKAS